MNQQLRTRLSFLAGMILTLFALLAIRLVGLSLQSEQQLRSERPAELTCLLISYDPVLGNDSEQLIDIWGPVDYAEGRWTSLNSGTIIGYGASEDTEIWNLPQCSN